MGAYQSLELAIGFKMGFGGIEQAEQLAAAGALVSDLHTRNETADALLAEIRQHRDSAQTAGKASGEARVAVAQATGEVQSTLLEARRAATDIAGLLASGAESRSKIEAELTAATDAAGQAGQIRRELGEFFDYARLQDEEMVAAGKQSQQFIADLRRDGQAALEALARQNAELKARAEKLQQEFEDLFGAAADGGLYQQFDELVQQSAPRQDKWLKRTIATGVGGACFWQRSRRSSPSSPLLGPLVPRWWPDWSPWDSSCIFVFPNTLPNGGPSLSINTAPRSVAAWRHIASSW